MKLNWNEVEIVIVTGQMPNICGHMLLSVGKEYFHFDGPNPYDYPQYLGDHFAYRNYLTKGNKYELLRRRATIASPLNAQKKLDELLGTKWQTALFTHNCASFVKEILNAGGNYVSFIEFCPKGNFIIEDIVRRLR